MWWVNPPLVPDASLCCVSSTHWNFFVVVCNRMGCEPQFLWYLKCLLSSVRAGLNGCPVEYGTVELLCLDHKGVIVPVALTTVRCWPLCNVEYRSAGCVCFPFGCQKCKPRITMLAVFV